jgi:hypothetical protein
MKNRRSFIIALALLGLAAAAPAAPVVQSLQFNSVILGSATTLQASVTDPGGSLVSATFYVSGPAVRDSLNLGAISWPTAQLVGTVGLSGSSGTTPPVSWQPPQIGTYTVTVYVADQTATTSQAGTLECVTGRLVIAPLTIASGVNRMFLHTGEILTTENQVSSNVVAQNGGSLIFWAGGRVVLKPGFRATTGAFFWAAVDHNMNGYSDIEESTCTSGDGIPDAWKVDHGLSILVNYSSQPQYLAAYRGGYDPTNTAATGTLPANTQLVIRTPSSGYYGVNTSTWAISGL